MTGAPGQKVGAGPPLPRPPRPGSQTPPSPPATPAQSTWPAASSAVLLLSGPLLATLAAMLGDMPASGPEHGVRVLALVLTALAPSALWLRFAPDASRAEDARPPAAAGTGAGPTLAPGAGWGGDPRLQFVASMGHDLRSPLNAMLGFADLLQMTAGPDDAAQADSVEVIHQRTSDLLVLIDDMLMWAKLESGGLTLRASEVAVPVLLQRASELATARSGARGLTVQRHCPPSLPAVAVDTERVVQAIVALLHDAVHATRPATVKLAARLTRDGVVVEVHDPQLLVRSADQDAFFEPFRPSFAPSGQRVAGLGVGMACARAFIRAHGGELSLTTEAGRGTTFAMVLPVARA